MPGIIITICSNAMPLPAMPNNGINGQSAVVSSPQPTDHNQRYKLVQKYSANFVKAKEEIYSDSIVIVWVDQYHGFGLYCITNQMMLATCGAEFAYDDVYDVVRDFSLLLWTVS